MIHSSPRQQKIAMLQMLLCGALWSIAGIFIKQIPWNPLVIAGGRSLIAAATVALALRLRGEWVRITRRGLLGGAFLCMTVSLFVAANKLTTSANAIALQFTGPIFILLFSALIFRQKFAGADVAAVAVTSAGIALFFLDQLDPGRLTGNFVAVAAGAASGAMYMTLGRCDAEERMGAMLLGHLFTAVIGLPFAFFTPVELSGPALGSLLILGVVQLGIPYMLLVKAQEHCSPLAANLLSVVEPILNPVWVFLFDGETPGLFALMGAAVVIATVTLWSVAQTRRTPATNEE